MSWNIVMAQDFQVIVKRLKESKLEEVSEVDPMCIAFLYRHDTWRSYPIYTTYDSLRKEFVGSSKPKNV